MVERDSSQITI